VGKQETPNDIQIYNFKLIVLSLNSLCGKVQISVNNSINQNYTHKETKGRVYSVNDCYHSFQNSLSSHLLYEDMKTKIHSIINLLVTVILQNIFKLLATGLPVPFSFLVNTSAVRMLANLLQKYTWFLLNHFSKLRLSISNFANLCAIDDTITILLGADFFNSSVTQKLNCFSKQF